MRLWRQMLGGIDTCSAKRGRGKTHYVKVRKYPNGRCEPASRALCGVRVGDPAPEPLMGGGLCKACFRQHPVWGSTS